MSAQVPITELLARLNALRADLGKPALKAWKESRAKLEGEIASYVKQAEAKLEADVKAKEAAADTKTPADLKQHPLVKERELEGERIDNSPTGRKAPTKKQAKVNEKAKAAAEQRKAKADSKDMISLADLARELSINPKVARAKARRHSKVLASLKVAGAEGWEFPASAKAAVVKVLKGEK